MKSKITIILIIYNDEAFGRRAIESVLNQTSQCFDLLILDNGSTDNSSKMIDSYSLDPRVKIIKNSKNQRSEFAAKVALGVETEYLSFLFSDDYYEANRIEKQLKILINDPSLDAVFSSNLYVSNNYQMINASEFVGAGDVSSLSQFMHLASMITRGNTLHPCSMIIRSETYKKLGGFKGYLHRIGDMTFFSKLLIESNVAFMSDKLQKITIWNNGRNESSSNAFDYLGIYFERSAFLKNLRLQNALLKLPLVFPDISHRLQENFIESERMFYLGYKLVSVGAIDYISFGSNILFEAYDRDSDYIESICKRDFNCSFGELSYMLSKGQNNGPDFFLLKLKSFLKKHRLFVFIYRKFFKKN